GVKGFSVYAGGELGSNPAVAVKIEDFVADNEILQVAEAVKRLFDKYGDRSNKHKARLRYVVGRIGAEEFVKLYQSERDEISKQGLKGDIPQLRDIASCFEVSKLNVDDENRRITEGNNILPEKTEGLFTIKLDLNLGDIPANDLVKVGQIAEEFSQGLVTTTQLQNLLITSVPRQNVEKAKSALEGLSIDVFGDDRPKVVTCTGAATCKLGLCLSRGLADAISKNLAKDDKQQSETIIRISGCLNSCGHHYIADIGLQGKAKRVNGVSILKPLMTSGRK
ncbi:unnamed protein product, partial [marine sediment metagenome]